MGNSIFDDDDDGFSLSEGIEGEGQKKSLPAQGKPVTKSAPPRPGTNRATGMPPATGQRTVPPRPAVQTGRTAPSLPKAPSAPVTPTVPTQKLATKPVLPVAKKPLPVSPANSLPVIPPAVYAKPEETYTENVIPSQPIHVEPEDISYTGEVEESIREDYISPDDYEADRRAEEEADRRAEERAAERRRERAREQERADRIVREREEREAERRRLEKDVPVPVVEEPAKVLSRKEQAAAKREAEKAKRDARKNKGKSKGEKPVSNFSGDRSKVLILRVVVFGFIAVLALAGLKATFLPPAQPTANNMIETAKFGLGITKFPTDKGSAFVLGFSEVYLTVQKDGARDRTKEISIYAPGNVLSAQGFSTTGGNETVDAQTVTSGPYISGVVSKDDTNAVYTVSAKLNNTQWVYIDVPVQYNLESQTFVISGAPSFVPAPERAEEVVPLKKAWATDDAEAVKEFTPDAKLFFEAWAKSTSEVIDVHSTPDADTATKSGLKGVVSLKDISSVSIQPAEEAESNTIRKATVVVIWNNSLAPGTSYSQTYDLVLVKADGENHWKIKTLQGGVPLSSAS